MNKKIITIIFTLSTMLFLVGCSFTNNESSDGSYSYVCKECRKKCAWCGKKATRHYENMMHKEVFVCEETYKKMHDD